MDRVELQYARREGRGRRGARWMVRRWWLIVILVVAVVGWVYRGEILRKGRVMMWQRRMMSMSVPAGKVVYESRVGEAAKLLGGDREYVTDGMNGACWSPAWWRELPGSDVDFPGGRTRMDMFQARAGVIFCGELVRADGTARWVIVALNAKHTQSSPRMSMEYWDCAEIFFYEPETLRRRAVLWDSRTPRARTMLLPGGRAGSYCVYGAHVAADDRSAFEFEVMDGGKRFLVRGRLKGDDSFEMSVKELES